jgi:hypothetical protein
MQLKVMNYSARRCIVGKAKNYEPNDMRTREDYLDHLQSPTHCCSHVRTNLLHDNEYGNSIIMTILGEVKDDLSNERTL